ncbi:ionotropic receptor 93a-like [Macrobrachium rosenbergii]|uniref:ionotropic receptor 93a-like n=1 Tax=Macrobrachium rosenbergii TaxID=79674 RepID=UPI0034D6B7AB
MIQVLQTAPSLNLASGLTAQRSMAGGDGPNEISPVVLSIATLWRNCSYLLFTDGQTSGYEELAKDIAWSLEFQGTAQFEASVEEEDGANFTVSEKLASVAREVRLHFRCVVVVVVSDCRVFLESFAESSLRGRLLSGTSTLIAVGRLAPQDVEALSKHWTFSMYNSLVIAPGSSDGNSKRCVLCLILRDFWVLILSSYLSHHLAWVAMRLREPPSNLGGDKRERERERERERDNRNPPNSFHGATVNISALPYEPYWMEETTANGDVISSGTDKLMLDAMQSTLNFTARALKVTTWDEVVQRVVDREAWLSPIIHAVYESRLKRFDYTRTYEHDVNVVFVMAKPVPESKWQSLYYPLTNEVWLCILGTSVIACLGLIGVGQGGQKMDLVIRGSEKLQDLKRLSAELVILDVLGTLLGQGLSNRLPETTASTKVLLLIWLTFAFIVGTVYKGNLMAFLVAPRYPPRPETLEELVKIVQRATMPSFGNPLREILRNSETESMRALGNKMELGYEIEEGLRLTLQKKYPHFGSLRFLQYEVAERYTDADGTSPLYLGREGIMPIFNAWPIPHDAPYKEDLDFVVLALIEGGIYNKWMEDWLEEAKRVGRQSRRRQKLEAGARLESWTGEFPTEATNDMQPRALNLVHFQGPLMLLALGTVLAGLSFLAESFNVWFSSAKGIWVRLRGQNMEKLL